MFGFAGLLASGLCSLYWSEIVGTHWPTRHAWLFHSHAMLWRDVAILNFASGASLYLLFRLFLSPVGSVMGAVIAAIGLAFVSTQKMLRLGLPLLPWDLWFANNAASFAEFLGLSRLTLLLAVCSIGSALLYACWRWSHLIFRVRGHALGATVGLIVVAAWIYGVIKVPTPLLLSGQVHNIAWDQGGNFANYGPYYTFLVNLKFLAVAPPSRAEADAAALVDAQPAISPASSVDRPDVVMFLSESFTNLPVEVFKTPYTCLAQAPQSKLVTPAWGGYTANVEFELLTGYPNSLFPIGAVPYQMYLKRPLPAALPQVFRDQGYRTTALHTYFRNFFSRPEAYRMLGFDTYRGLEDLGRAPRRGQYVSDQVLFDAINHQLDEERSGPQLIHAVSMMAHLPYDWPGRYPIDPRLSSRLPASLEQWRNSLSQYASMMFDHEAMLCSFLSALKKRPRRTLVLFYGDHYPSFGSLDVYKAVHSELHGVNPPFDLAQQYAKTPLALFDSSSGFVELASEIPAYNLGVWVLQRAGLPLPGLWAMPHKLQNRMLAHGVYLANHQEGRRVGDQGAVSPDPELEALRAHVYRSMLAP